MGRGFVGADMARWSVASASVVLLLSVLAGFATLAQEKTVAQGSLPVGTPYFVPLINADGDPTQSSAVIPNQWIVVLKSTEVRAATGNTVSAVDLAMEMVDAAGGELLYAWDAILEGFAAVLPPDALSTLAADPRVDWIEPDQIVFLDPAERETVQSHDASQPEIADPEGSDPDGSGPDDSEPGVFVQDVAQRPAPWGLDRIDQRNLPLDNTFNYTLTGQGVNVYLLDSGIRSTHTEFSGRIGSVLYVINDGLQGFDCNGHGTHVAGTIAGTTWGVAKRATLHSLRVLDCDGSGSVSGIIEAMNWVRINHVKPAVVNMSLGGLGANAAEELAVRNLVAAGVTVVVAAGNSNANACNFTPAREPAAITVGNSTSSDTRDVDSSTSGSNWGACLDLFAPGAEITSASNLTDSGSVIMSGTSMASPHVAGAVALYLQAHRNAAPAQVIAALLSATTPNKIGNPGSGSPNRLLYMAAFAAPTPTPTTIPDSLVRMIFIRRTSTTPTNTPVPGSTPTPTPIPTATSTRTPTPTLPAPPVSCDNLLADGSFEATLSGWVQSSLLGYDLICTLSGCEGTVAPRTGAKLAWLGGLHNEFASIEQTVTIPSGATPRLSYWYQVGSQEATCDYDLASSFVDDGSGRVELAPHPLCTANQGVGWRQQVVDMSAWVGRTVSIGMAISTDGDLNSNLFADDFYLYPYASCLSATVSVALTADDAALSPPPAATPDSESGSVVSQPRAP